MSIEKNVAAANLAKEVLEIAEVVARESKLSESQLQCFWRRILEFARDKTNEF
jgi:hypothetical protein